ncbi:MAG: TenA family protein, partial [Bacteroidales bacterium]|nr:TenA family protein [Bacteroidales bacterium]
ERWTEHIWKKASKTYNDILNHQFIKDISDGSLSADRFNRYVSQDEIYLRDYAEHMFAVADMIPDKDLRDMFIQFAKDGLEGEKAMHQLLIQRFGTDLNVESSYVTSAYNHRIISGINTGVLPIAFAAILPCMWVYNQVGLHILKGAKLEGNPYKEWIQEYSNDEFTKGAEDLLKVIDKYAAEADEKTRIQMDKVFLNGVLLEYAFWDYGFYGEEGSYEYIK